MTATGELETRIMRHVTCLGCGCACDDITVVTEGKRIVHAATACLLGEAWFGDGRMPSRAMVRGAPAALDTALDSAAALLVGAERVLVCLAPELSCEAQREGVAIADRLGAIVDVASSDLERELLLATQRHGIATATLGEIRHRADVAVFWGADPTLSHPRFAPRFIAPALESGRAARASRTIVAVDVGDARAVAHADARIVVPAGDEVEALGVIHALVLGHALDDHGMRAPAWLGGIRELASRLTAGRYVALICEPGDEGGDARRAEALVTLVQALNAVTRAALVVLRRGGNRAGAEAVLTWQTGFPAGVDFARGAPRYGPERDAASLCAERVVDAVLVLGAVHDLPARMQDALASRVSVVIGPWASDYARGTTVAIDTGVAGIHQAGLAMRMDGVPLPLHAPLPGAPSAANIARALAGRLGPREVVR